MDMALPTMPDMWPPIAELPATPAPAPAPLPLLLFPREGNVKGMYLLSTTGSGTRASAMARSVAAREESSRGTATGSIDGIVVTDPDDPDADADADDATDDGAAALLGEKATAAAALFTACGGCCCCCCWFPPAIIMPLPPKTMFHLDGQNSGSPLPLFSLPPPLPALPLPLPGAAPSPSS
jgi:hypothetical protein